MCIDNLHGIHIHYTLYIHEGNGILTEHVVSCFAFYGFSADSSSSGCMSSSVREEVAADSTPALD